MEINITNEGLTKVIIHPIKDSWNREELKSLCSQAYITGGIEDDKACQKDFESWFNSVI